MEKGLNNVNTLDNETKVSAPLLSIITVSLNEAKTIEHTIQSVLNQSYQNFEYIIIDGGSKDGTLEIIKKYEPYLTVWKSESDKGIFDAMNKGISHTRGDLIGIINANDWFEPNCFATVAESYLSSDRNTVIYGMLRNFMNDKFYSIKANSTEGLQFDMIQHSTCFIPKSIYSKYGLYDENYLYSADYDYILRLVKNKVKFRFLENVLANFRLGGASSSRKAQVEMIEVKVHNDVISKAEGLLRKFIINTAFFAKKIL